MSFADAGKDLVNRGRRLGSSLLKGPSLAVGHLYLWAPDNLGHIRYQRRSWCAHAAALGTLLTRLLEWCG
jgi:hypothetical protein